MFAIFFFSTVSCSLFKDDLFDATEFVIRVHRDLQQDSVGKEAFDLEV